MKKIILVVLLSMCNFAFSQDKGTVKGLLTDKEMNNEPLPFANVYIKGTTKGITTDMDGLYTLDLVPGEHTLVFSFVGYKSIEKPIRIISGKTITVNELMGASEGQMIEEVVIQASSSVKEKESALLLEQKKAVIIKESIGSVELSKKGVSNAAAATVKVSGVAKQEGSSKIYVRGLGDRYNSTTLNGLPLPSNNPSNKNISLDLFSTDIIQNVGVSKSFSSSLSGDASGANIDVKTKEFSGKSNVNLSIGFGGNSQTTLKPFNRIDGTNWLGVASHTEHNVVSLKTVPFKDKFAPLSYKTAPLASNFTLSGGQNFKLGEASSFSMFLVGGFSNNLSFRDGFSVNILNTIKDKNGSFSGFTKGSDYSDAKEYTYSNSKLAMGNFTYKINSANKIRFNSLFIHSNSQKVQQYKGTTSDIGGTEGELAYNVLQTQNQNKLFVNQLLSEHKIGAHLDFNIGLSFNKVKNDEPNRKKNLFVLNTLNNTAKFASGTPRNNSRYYHNLDENDINGGFSLIRYFGDRSENNGNVTLGYAYRNTIRNFSSIFFDYNLSGASTVDVNNPDSVLSQKGLEARLFRFQTGRGRGENALNPFTYNASKYSHAPYVNVNYNVSDEFFVSGGLRYELVDMDVSWDTNLGNSGTKPQNLNNNYFLPSLNLKYNLTSDNLVRLSASKTYTYPQFKEVAPFIYEGVNYSEYGNTALKPSNNYNLDLKWEMFPKKDELISATVFGKLINNAINRIELNAASDNVFSFYNTGDSKVLGLELEFKKNIWNISEEKNEKLKFGFNTTYMYNKQVFNRTVSFSPTNDTDPLEGAAPLLINSDITYSKVDGNKTTNASLVFNYQHAKLYSIGTVNKIKGIYQKGLPRLDFILKKGFTDKLGAKFSVKNIINPKIERYRNLPTSPVTRSYRNGVNVSLGFNYKF